MSTCLPDWLPDPDDLLYAPSDSSERLDVINPATGDVIGSIPRQGAEAARMAVDKSEAAAPSWAAMTMYERGSLMNQWLLRLQQARDDLARIIVLENGKILREAKAEIDYGLSYLAWFIEEGKRAYGRVIPPRDGQQRLLTRLRPVGTCALITPWNFPHAMLMRKLAAALMTGCTAVCKPSELTPFSALAMKALAREAGLPEDIFQLVMGDAPAIGGAWCEDVRVRKLSFTGSTRVGQQLARASASTLKRLSLELGGNAPFIVFEDADLDAALDGLLASKFRGSGQTCIASNRVLVQEGVLEPFAEKLKKRMAELRLGPGLQPDADIGPLIDQRAVDRLHQWVDGALAGGARLLYRSTVPQQGCFYPVTLITDVPDDAPLSCQEIFGPVVVLRSFGDEAEAIRRANATPAGLAAYFYSNDIHRCTRVAEALEFGMVGINEGRISNASAPFGGIKMSGYGREGGEEGLLDYCSVQYLCYGHPEARG
jgi:succinate-semialdehyde dehydrogenase/glutarate-semialdehyde dehydrogenase